MSPAAVAYSGVGPNQASAGQAGKASLDLLALGEMPIAKGRLDE